LKTIRLSTAYFKSLFLISISLWFATVQLHAQDVAAIQFSPGEDVPFQSVYGNIIQDSSNFLWFGTDNGLFRYDGKTFLQIPLSEEVVNPEALVLSKGMDETLWFINLANQICYLSPRRDTIRVFHIKDIPTGVKAVKLVVQDSFMVMSFQNFENVEGTGFYRVHIPSRKMIEKFESRGTGYMEFDLLADGSILFYSGPDSNSRSLGKHPIRLFKNNESRIVAYVPAYQPVREYYIFANPNKKASRVFLFEKMGRKDFLYYEKGGVTRLPKTTSTDFNEINAVYQGPDSHFYFATDKGYWIADSSLQKGIQSDRNLLVEHEINNFCHDHEGNLWVGTNREGVFFIPNQEAKTYTPENSPLFSEKISNFLILDSIRMIIGSSDGRVYLIKNGELKPGIRINEAGQNMNEVIHLSKLDDQTIIANLLNQPPQIIKINDQDQLSFDDWLDLSLSKKIPVKTYKSTCFIPGTQLAIFGDWGHSYEVGLDASDLPVMRSSPISSVRNTSLMADAFEPYVWIGEARGIKRYHYPSKEILAPKIDGIPEDFLVSDLAQSKDSTIWIGTTLHGVFGIKNNKIRYHFHTGNGLPDNNCRSLFLDDQDGLWIGTNRGIARIKDLAKGEIDFIDESDGLLTERVNDLCVHQNQLWVATDKGLFQIPLSSLARPTPPTPIHISSIRINRTEVPLSSSLQLHHGENELEIQFSSMVFRAKEKLNYQYRMLGIDSSWITISSVDNIVRFPQLNPGAYRFEVVPLDELGKPEAQKASLDISIAPPFWTTRWFILLFLTGIIGLTAGIVSFFQRNARLKKEREQRYLNRIEKLRSAALRSQMNPHFIFNTLNAILYFLNQNDRKKSAKFLAKFSRLIRYIFEHSKHDAITLSEEILFLETYLNLEQLRFGDKIKIHFEVQPHLKDEQIKVPPLLVQPIIENSFKHGLFHKEEQGNLWVRLQEKEEVLLIRIQDDGIGRAAAEQKAREKMGKRAHSSQSIIEERLQLLNSRLDPSDNRYQMEVEDLFDDMGKPAGTRTTLRFPIL
jgi:ligand-binding sensor domain-containing protein/two-component sensor histidine kinase